MLYEKDIQVDKAADEQINISKSCLNSCFSSGIIDRTGAQIMLYLTCTMVSSVDLAHYGVSRAKDWAVSVDYGTISFIQ